MSEIEKKITITLTAGDVCENHVHMQQLGKLVEKGKGFNKEDLEKIKEFSENKSIKCELIDLTKLIENIKNKKDNSKLVCEKAYILVLRDAINKLFKDINVKDLFKELNKLKCGTLHCLIQKELIKKLEKKELFKIKELDIIYVLVK